MRVSRAKVAWGRDRWIRDAKILGIVIALLMLVRIFVGDGFYVLYPSMETSILQGDYVLVKKLAYALRTPDRIGIPWTRIGIRIPSASVWRFREPERRDVVLFENPTEPGRLAILRIVAGPGKKLSLREGRVRVNGRQLQEPAGVFWQQKPFPKVLKEPGIFPAGMGNRDHYGPLRVPARGDTLRFADMKPDWIAHLLALEKQDFLQEKGKVYINGEERDCYVLQQDYYFLLGDNRHDSHDSRYWGLVPARNIRGKVGRVYFSVRKMHSDAGIERQVRWERIATKVR